MCRMAPRRWSRKRYGNNAETLLGKGSVGEVFGDAAGDRVIIQRNASVPDIFTLTNEEYRHEQL